MRTGQMIPLLHPDKAAAHPNFPEAMAMSVTSLVGTSADVVAGMKDLATRTQAAELMLYTPTHGLTERVDSLEYIADEWNRAEA